MATLTEPIAPPLQTAPGRQSKLLVGVACIIYFAALAYYAHVRAVDGDEGYYTTAARLVWEGEVPYHDFAYPQAPLLPYLYSWVSAVWPHSLIGMRLFSVACGAIAASIWAFGLASLRRLPRRVTIATIAIVLLNPYWISWNVVVKTFAVANLLTTVAVISVYLGLRRSQPAWLFAAAVSLSLCASVRGLYVLVPVAVFVALAYLDWQSGTRWYRRSLAFLAGALCGSMPMVISFAADPHAFVFNNVHYHHILFSNVTIRHTAHMDLILVYNMFYPFRSMASRYFTLEVLLAGIGVINLWRMRRNKQSIYDQTDGEFLGIALLMLAVYLATIAISLVPAPDQYFNSPLLPFMIPFMAEGLRVLFKASKKWVIVLAVALPLFAFSEINLAAQEWAGYPWSSISSYKKVATSIQVNSTPAQTVLSIWPGYVFEAGRQYFAGSEDHFNYALGKKLSRSERQRYHLLFADEIIAALQSGAVQVYVTDANIWHFDSFLSPQQSRQLQAELDADYSLVDSIDGVKIYRRR